MLIPPLTCHDVILALETKVQAQDSTDMTHPDDTADRVPRGSASVGKERNGNVWIYLPYDESRSATVTVHTEGRPDQTLLLNIPKIEGQIRTIGGNFQASDYVLPGGLLYVYYRNTDILLPGANPQRIGTPTHPEVSSVEHKAETNPQAERIKEGKTVMEREHVQDMIALSEARTDTKFERLIGEMRETAARQDMKFDALALRIEQFQTDVREGRAEARSNRNIILATVLPTVLATGLAVGGFLLASQANLLSAFQAGVALRSAPIEKAEPTKP